MFHVAQTGRVSKIPEAESHSDVIGDTQLAHYVVLKRSIVLPCPMHSSPIGYLTTALETRMFSV